MNCNECGQKLPLDQEMVKNPDAVFEVTNLQKLLQHCEGSLGHNQVGESIDFTGLPDGFDFKVVATEMEPNVDSYGDEVQSGYMVFELSNETDTKFYKAEVVSDSYGIDKFVNVWSLTAVVSTPRTVLVWDEV